MSNCSICIFCFDEPKVYSPLMTGVNTAIPSYFGLLTVLSRIRPPRLDSRQIAFEISKAKVLIGNHKYIL